MGKKSKVIKPHLNKGVITEYTEKLKTASVKELNTQESFVISFKHFDRDQSDDFNSWQTAGILANAIETLGNYCHRPLMEQCGTTFKIYGDFPLKSDYKHPRHVPPDANWARIHVNGVHILAGHVFNNTFYLVFLDSKHRFSITKGADN